MSGLVNGQSPGRVLGISAGLVLAIIVGASQGIDLANKVGLLGPPVAISDLESARRWETRGIVIETGAAERRRILDSSATTAEAVKTLALAIQSMNDSIRRLEEDGRDHSREARRAP